MTTVRSRQQMCEAIADCVSDETIFLAQTKFSFTAGPPISDRLEIAPLKKTPDVARYHESKTRKSVLIARIKRTGKKLWEG